MVGVIVQFKLQLGNEFHIKILSKGIADVPSSADQSDQGLIFFIIRSHYTHVNPCVLQIIADFHPRDGGKAYSWVFQSPLDDLGDFF